MLREIARHLDTHLRSVGTYARLESDRFALCFPARLFETQALLASANQMLTDLHIGIRVVLYAGVFNVEDVTLSIDQMCDRAYMALKTIKGKYHERFAYYDSAMRDQLMLEQTITSEMNDALQQDQFCFYLQPIYSITTGLPVSAEALVRWKHPQKGLIPPGDFIPLFERNGFITKLDTYLWERVCQYLHDLKADGIEPLPISVNVSRLNLFTPSLCQDILSMVRRYGLDPSMLKLEITETAYTDNPQQLLSAIQTLHAYGFEIMMDDFGSGYSSLNMLKDLPVDILKVDMRFLTGMENNGRAANVMTSIIRMGKWLDIVVIAEGVETVSQIDFLRSVGCDEVQGYYYSHPIPTEEFTALLRNPDAMYKQHQSDRERLLSDFDINTLWDSNQQVTLLFSGMIGAIALYEKTDDVLEVLRVNESYFELMGSTPQSLLNKEQDAIANLEAADYRAVVSACDCAKSSHRVEQAQISCPRGDGSVVWLDIKIRHLGNVGPQDLFYFALSDITRQKELDRNFLLYQYGTAMLDAYSEVMEVNYTDRLTTSFSFSGTTSEYHTHTVPLDQMLRTMVDTRVHPQDRVPFANVYEQSYLENAFRNQKRRSVSIELRLCGADQAYRWTRLTIHPMEDATGKFRALCCYRNIDEQKQTERIRAEYAILQAKQQEQERYRIILEQTQTALLAWSLGAEQAEGNALAKYYRLSEVSCSSLLKGEVPEEIADPLDAEALHTFLATLQNQTNASCILRLLSTNGEKRWCKLCVTVQRNAEDHITAILATINDVDHEHRIQLQLETQRAQNDRRLSMLSHLYWTLPCCILQLDLNDPPQPIFFNRACWELFGFQTKEAFDAVADRDIFALIAPEEKEGFLALLRRCRDQLTLETVDVTVIRPDGSRGSLRGNSAVSHRSDGSPMLQLVLLDTTVQREQEKRLERTRATLQRTTEMLEHLLENLPVGVTLFEFGDVITALYSNSRAYSMFALKDHKPARFMELMKLEKYHTCEGVEGKSLRAVDDAGNDLSAVSRMTREDGSPFWLRTYYSIVPQPNSPPLCYAVLADVSQHVQIERAYNRQSELYRITMEDSQQIFFDYDLEKDVMNYTVRPPTGEREERLVANYVKSLRHSHIIYPEHIPGLQSAIRQYSRTTAPATHEFMANYFGTGEFRWYRAYFRSLKDESGTLYRMIGRVVDIEEEKVREAQLGQAKVFRRAVNSVSLFVFAFTLPDKAPYLLSSEDLQRSGFYPYLEYLDGERISTLVHEEERQALIQTLHPQTLITYYRSGSRELTIPFRALNRQQSWIWLELKIHLSPGVNKNAIDGIG